MRFHPNNFRKTLEVSILLILFLAINYSKQTWVIHLLFGASFLIIGFQLAQAIWYRMGKANFYLLPTPSDNFHRFLAFFTGGFLSLTATISYFFPLEFVHAYNGYFLGLGILILLNGIFKNAYKKWQFFDGKIYVDDMPGSIDISTLAEINIKEKEIVFTQKNGSFYILKHLLFTPKQAALFYAFLQKSSLSKQVEIKTAQ